MNKSFWVGVGHAASGLVGIAAVRFIFGFDLPFVVVVALICGIGIYALQHATRHAYNMGKKDGMSAAQKVEQDRTTEGAED